MVEDLWYKNTVIYSLDLETFMDADGDGVGDFEGLMRRLDYLHSLGVETLWLAPFQPSPNRDNGYDIADYYGVDPRHGSSGDFVEFMNRANKLGIKVIMNDGVQMMFNFFVNQRMFYALATGDTEPLIDALRATCELPPGAQWAQFLRNHDELDLGRLSEEQRARVFAKFGPEERMQLYDRGIRRRLASMLGDRRQIELAYSLLFSLPGTPVIRYGDEIGMGEDLSLAERNSVRTPMQWVSEPQSGFSTARQTVHPVIDQGPYSYELINVESQRRDPNSLLNWTAQMIRLRTTSL